MSKENIKKALSSLTPNELNVFFDNFFDVISELGDDYIKVLLNFKYRPENILKYIKENQFSPEIECLIIDEFYEKIHDLDIKFQDETIDLSVNRGSILSLIELPVKNRTARAYHAILKKNKASYVPKHMLTDEFVVDYLDNCFCATDDKVINKLALSAFLKSDVISDEVKIYAKLKMEQYT